MTVEAVLESKKGLIVAPAGCGKTHLITETLKIPPKKPYLVLTHTTAGVAAIKQRLNRLKVPISNYVVTTIDGWARRIANIFPISCNVVGTPDNPRYFYPELRKKVGKYVNEGHIGEIIQSSYSRLMVDEYQDCNSDQHSMICSLSKFLPTIIFGDPMQSIFTFSGTMPCWNSDVQNMFPVIIELNTPWRWINAGTLKLGEWILSCRRSLHEGFTIDLNSCPEYVKWYQLTGNSQADANKQIEIQYKIRKNSIEDSLLIIGNSSNSASRHQFAASTKGIDVVEPVDLSDIINIASKLDSLEGYELSICILDSLTKVMTGIRKTQLLKRVESIMASRNRTPATDMEVALQYLVESGDRQNIKNLISCFENSSETRIFRMGAFTALKKAVELSVIDSNKTIKQSAEIIREQRRHQGDRRIPKKAIGSTLLLKGLEADHSFILNAGEMNPQNLYVSLSRGAKSITAFANRNVIP